MQGRFLEPSGRSLPEPHPRPRGLRRAGNLACQDASRENHARWHRVIAKKLGTPTSPPTATAATTAAPSESAAGRKRAAGRWSVLTADRTGRMVRAAARVSGGGIAARSPAPVSPPSVTGTIQTPVPGKVRRPPDAEVRIRAPTPEPRCGHPRPANSYAIDVLIWRGGAVGSFVDVPQAIWHPDPAILARVDPLTRDADAVA
jgi:hypothetical protein